MIVMLLAMRDRIDAQATPTPVIPIHTEPLFEGVEDTSSITNDLASDITAPEGIPLLPDTSFSKIFGYAKWLLSPSAADEIVGPFAPLIVHTGVFITLLIVAGGLYTLVYMAVFILKIVAWIVRWILEILQAIAQIGSVAAEIIGTIVDVIWPF